MSSTDFIQIRTRNGDDLFNPAHIVSVEKKEIPIIESKRAQAKEEGIEGDTVYYIIINLVIPAEGREYVCPNKAERDAMFDVIAESLTPLFLTPAGPKRLKPVQS